MNAAPRKHVQEELRKLLAEGDVKSALRYLNNLTPHRFSALYQFKGSVRQNHYFIDKRDPTGERERDVPVSATYCAFVKRTGQRVTIADAQPGAQPEGQRLEKEIRAYTGVPLVDRQGNVFGTVCHFDYRPMNITDTNVALMEALADLLQEHVPQPK